MRIQKELRLLADPKKARILAGFFKTGKGEYGEGDQFLGIAVPLQRKIAKQFSDLELFEIEKLLSSDIHEERLTSLLILVSKFEKGNEKTKDKIYQFYLKNTKKINNWDLVDLSAPKISGAYLLKNKEQRKILYKLARSKNLWERRIAIISTFAFLREDQFEDTFKISEILLEDRHDLIHKAVGWMLREVGNRNRKAEEKFLQKYYRQMPRTMLRYAIEKFDRDKKEFYMKR